MWYNDRQTTPIYNELNFDYQDFIKFRERWYKKFCWIRNLKKNGDQQLTTSGK